MQQILFLHASFIGCSDGQQWFISAVHLAQVAAQVAQWSLMEDLAWVCSATYDQSHLNWYDDTVIWCRCTIQIFPTDFKGNSVTFNVKSCLGSAQSLMTKDMWNPHDDQFIWYRCAMWSNFSLWPLNVTQWPLMESLVLAAAQPFIMLMMIAF